MINIIVCDDDRDYAMRIADMITDLSVKHDIDLDIEVCGNGSELMENIKSGKCDIIFLDIMLGGENGIELAKRIKELLPDVLFVFLTGYIDFAVQGYEVRAFRYLLKGSAETELERTLIEAVNEINKVSSFSFSYKQEFFKVKTNDILYMESDKRLIIIHAADKTYQYYGRLDEAEELSGFIRIHRSYLVNPERLVSLTKETAVLSDGTRLNVSGSYAESAKRKFMLYI
ncbi:MAG: response regulator transcription factor [Oscillospiraceae bacterium]|nr:response regulator transcription factor [Oscillospiraceae bacterium]